MLMNIDDEHFEYAHRALRWLAFSVRPLSLEEAAEAVIMKPGYSSLCPDDRLFDSRAILTICPSLVILTEEKKVQLAHYSVKEYLLSDRIKISSASRFSILEIPANSVIAEACLAYLLMLDQPDSLSAQSFQDYPLLEYAATYWFEHARCAIDVNTPNEIARLSVKLVRRRARRFSTGCAYMNLTGHSNL